MLTCCGRGLKKFENFGNHWTDTFTFASIAYLSRMLLIPPWVDDILLVDLAFRPEVKLWCCWPVQPLSIGKI